jgi:ParB family chromosome partitioning protein
MNEIRSIDISTIRLQSRIRKDLGDIQQLMESLTEFGLLNPIVVTPDLVLVAGQRRLEAARRLGWQTIQCRVLSVAGQEGLIKLEIAENDARKDFSSDEMADALLRLDRIRNPRWYRRLWRWIRAKMPGMR